MMYALKLRVMGHIGPRDPGVPDIELVHMIVYTSDDRLNLERILEEKYPQVLGQEWVRYAGMSQYLATMYPGQLVIPSVELFE